MNEALVTALEADIIDRNDKLDMDVLEVDEADVEWLKVEIPEPSDLDPQILSFIDQVVDRARGTGAFSAAQGFAQDRFKDDGNALNYCLFRLDEAQSASAVPASMA